MLALGSSTRSTSLRPDAPPGISGYRTPSIYFTYSDSNSQWLAVKITRASANLPPSGRGGTVIVHIYEHVMVMI